MARRKMSETQQALVLFMQDVTLPPQDRADVAKGLVQLELARERRANRRAKAKLVKDLQKQTNYGA